LDGMRMSTVAFKYNCELLAGCLFILFFYECIRK